MSDHMLLKEFQAYCDEKRIKPRNIHFQFWRDSRAYMQVKLPESGYWMGWGNDELMRAEEVRDAMQSAGLKVQS